MSPQAQTSEDGIRHLAVGCQLAPPPCCTFGQGIKTHAHRELGRPLNQRQVIAEFCSKGELGGSGDQVPVLQGLLRQPHVVFRTLRRCSSDRSGIGSDSICQN